MTDDYPEYVRGARFIDADGDIEEWLYPRDVDFYEPSQKFIGRVKELNGAIEGDDISFAINYGEMYAAARGCVAFVNDAGGVVYYIVVEAELKEHLKTKGHSKDEGIQELTVNDFNHRAVTVWPYVYDRDRAWDTGRWTGQELDIIESIEPEDDLR